MFCADNLRLLQHCSGAQLFPEMAAPLMLTLARVALHSCATQALHSDDATEAVLRSPPTMTVSPVEMQEILSASFTVAEV